MYYVYAIPREWSNPCLHPVALKDKSEAYHVARERTKLGYIVRVFYENPENGLWELVAPEVWRREDGECGGKAV
jgi:hypothetical protein